MNWMHTKSSLIFAAIALVSACTPTASRGEAGMNLPRDLNPPVGRSEVERLAVGNNAFALNLYQAVQTETGNLILSPYSISLALAMTYAGARGETQTQMERVLHFDLGQSLTHSAFNALDLELEEHGATSDNEPQSMRLTITNAVWVEQTYSLLQSFLNTITANYGAGIFLADFKNQFEAARLAINDWVNQRTQERIRDLLPQNSLNPNTRMVLVNAIYFKADWLDTFDAESTNQQAFYLLDGSQQTVDMMHKGLHIPYGSGNGYQVVELPYAAGTAVMDIIVPDEGKFQNIETSLDTARYYDILDSLQPASVDLGLPKFQFDKDINASEILKSMGLTDAFDASSADFSGMTGTRDLYISNVFHKAFVAVDEQGTEAAAATAVVMETTGAPMFDIILQVDRPFIFVIRDTESGQILFLGRVLNP